MRPIIVHQPVKDEARSDSSRDARPTLDQAANALARQQHGVLALGQLLEAGYSSRSVSRRACAGRLHRIHKSVYAIAPFELLQPDGLRMAAVLAAGQGAALSYRTAAIHHGLIAGAGTTRIDVTVPRGGERARGGLNIHRATNLRPEDVTTVRRVPTTTVARTLFDLSTVLSERRLERAIDEAVAQAEFQCGGDYETVAWELREQIEMNPGRRSECTALGRILDDREVGLPTWNEIEELMLAAVKDAGLPLPRVQATLNLDDGEPSIEPDFMWPDIRLIVETDGFREHGKRSSFESDRRRDQRAAAAGYETVRVTWRQLQDERPSLTRRLAGVYSARSELFAALRRR